MTRSVDRDQGLTLVELMVVLAIVGILLVAFAVMFRGRAPVPEAAQMLSNRLREASRQAVSGSVVDQSLADDAPTQARTRLRIQYDATNDIQIVTVEIRDESQPAGAEWFELTRGAVPGGATIYAYSDQLHVTATGWGDAYGSGSGSAPAHTVLAGPLSPSATATDVSFYCDPDGACDPVTFFLVTTDTKQQRRLRVVMMPLQGSPLTFSGW